MSRELSPSPAISVLRESDSTFSSTVWQSILLLQFNLCYSYFERMFLLVLPHSQLYILQFFRTV